MIDEGQGAHPWEPEQGAEGPLGEDLDELFVEQLRPVSGPVVARSVGRLRQSAPEPPVRQRGTLPGRLSPLRFCLRARGRDPLHELAVGAGALWGLGLGADRARLWRLELEADGEAELATAQPPPECSPVSLCAGLEGDLFVGDAWRGGFWCSAQGPDFRALPMLEDPAPVGASRLAPGRDGPLGVDGLGRLFELRAHGITAGPSVSGRVEALGSAEHWLVRDPGDERVRLRRPAEQGPTLDLGPWRREASARCALVVGARGVLALGVADDPLWVATGARALERWPDLPHAHAAAWVELGGEPALALALRVRERDLLCVRQGGVDALVLDLGEALEEFPGEAPRSVHALASEGDRVWAATDAGLLEIRFSPEAP